MEALTHITIDDVIRAGACRDDTYRIAEQYAGLVTKVSVEDAIRLVGADDEARLWVIKAARLDGLGGTYYGCGFAAGDGEGESEFYGSYGLGNGCGYGDGAGDDVYGHGDGHGDGAGCGIGYGVVLNYCGDRVSSGSGTAMCSGYGCGDGYGSDNGYGDGRSY